MTRFLIVAACLVFPSLALGAPADSSSVAPARANSLQSGAWAIQFVESGGFSAAGAFIKWHLNPGHALRFGAVFSLESRTGDTLEDTTRVTTTKGTSENDYFNVDASVISQHYLNPHAPAQVYLGIGPFVTYSEDKHVDDDIRFGERQARTSNHHAFRVGGTLILGGEWFASRSLSLAAEYGVRAGYISIKDEYSNVYESGPVQHGQQNESGWFTSGGDSRLALGIYF